MKKVILLIAVLTVVGCCLTALSETDNGFIMCQPDSYVNIRISPKNGAEIIGRYELGFKVETDGKKKNGFLHLVNLGLEATEGWVHAGFVSRDALVVRTVGARIKSNGRVACRKSINGNRRKWLANGDLVTVYAYSDSWAITNHGFIKTEFIDGL